MHFLAEICTFNTFLRKFAFLNCAPFWATPLPPADLPHYMTVCHIRLFLKSTCIRIICTWNNVNVADAKNKEVHKTKNA